MKKILILTAFLCLIYGTALSQSYVTDVSKVGTTSAQFLKIAVGSRAVGMGNAFVAVADDATAIYWNPAGLARLPQKEMSLTHTEWLADIHFDFGSLIIPMGEFGTIGASLTALTMPEMEVRTILEPEGTGEMFGASDLALCLSYAKNLTDRFSIGFNGKYIRQRIWHMSAFGFALDIGTLFTTRFNDMKIGMSISNFGNKLRFEGKDNLVYHDIDPVKYGNNDKINAHLEMGRWSLPLLFRVGVAMDLIHSNSQRLTVAIDAVHPNDNTENLNLGTEYIFNHLLSFRLGYASLFTRDSEEGLTLGIGLQHELLGTSILTIDYSYADFGRLQNAQRFSLGIKF